MKTLLSTIAYILASVVSYSQTFKLEASNPMPRVGDEVKISFELLRDPAQDTDIAVIKKIILGDNNSIGYGTFQFSRYFIHEQGPIHVGPFEFSIENKHYKTNSIVLHVQPQLPGDVVNGVWVKMATIDSVNYVVLEQRAPAVETNIKTDDGDNLSVSIPDIEWAAINDEKLRQRGIILKEQNSSITIQTLPNEKNVGHKVAVYTYEIGKSFTGKFTITKELIDNIPKGAHLEFN